MGTTDKTIKKSRYSDNELKEFKSLIERKLLQANEQLVFFQGQLEDLIDNPDAKLKSLDDAVGVAETEHLTGALSRLRKHINHLENALIRIENKVYGICRETGKLIAKERLRAVPHATLSIEAKLGRDKF